MTAPEPPVLVTGASGFVGRALVTRMLAEGLHPRGTARRATSELPPGAYARDGDLGSDFDWRSILAGCTAVIHTAARVHIGHARGVDSLTEYRRVNVDGTIRLARQAAQAGVRRFVYVSSIKVNGERTLTGSPFTAGDAPAPEDPYAISKHQAEEGLWRIGAETGLEVVVVRPVLVYGPGVKANFLSMLNWVARGVPLPLGAVRNRRSLVGLDNLVDLLLVCVRNHAAPGHTFLASDGEDLSTPELLRRTATALGRPARLIPVPVTILRAGAILAGKGAVARRLCESLQVDIAATRRVLGWNPPVTVNEQLRSTALWYRKSLGGPA